MDILRLYQDYNIPYETEGHKHCRPGWANTECPFCSGNKGIHLGVSINSAHFYCWRCGWHPAKKAIAALLKINEQEAAKILKEYIGISQTESAPVVKIRRKTYKHPTATGTLLRPHEMYLKQRDFIPLNIAKQWGVLGTGPASILDGINYSHRLFIPIYWQGKEVTFQTRDITGKHKMKYLACPMEREVFHHKHIIYRHPDAVGDTGILVEGVTDVWRFGKDAFACFGIETTTKQVRLISNLFKRVFIVFDDDPQAVVNAEKIAAELRFRNTEAHVIEIEGDPANMPQQEADKLIYSLLKKS